MHSGFFEFAVMLKVVVDFERRHLVDTFSELWPSTTEMVALRKRTESSFGVAIAKQS